MNHEWFRRMARRVSLVVGSPYAFTLAVIAVIVWALTGPLFGFSDTWQLVINTATTVVTFLVVFMIQNTQTHDSRALHIKLDELIRAVHAARNRLVAAEELSDDELQRLEGEFRKVREIRDPEALRHHRHQHTPDPAPPPNGGVRYGSGPPR
jgi:low affinity Fe/Cu permease